MKTRNLIVQMSFPEYQAALDWLSRKATSPESDGPGMMLLDRLGKAQDGGLIQGKPIPKREEPTEPPEPTTNVPEAPPV